MLANMSRFVSGSRCGFIRRVAPKRKSVLTGNDRGFPSIHCRQFFPSLGQEGKGDDVLWARGVVPTLLIAIPVMRIGYMPEGAPPLSRFMRQGGDFDSLEVRCESGEF